jgi:hypothetical protein
MCVVVRVVGNRSLPGYPASHSSTLASSPAVSGLKELSHSRCGNSYDYNPPEAAVGEVEPDSNEQEAPTRNPQTDHTTPRLRGRRDLNQGQGKKKRSKDQSADDQEPEDGIRFHVALPLRTRLTAVATNRKKIPLRYAPPAAQDRIARS